MVKSYKICTHHYPIFAPSTTTTSPLRYDFALILSTISNKEEGMIDVFLDALSSVRIHSTVVNSWMGVGEGDLEGTRDCTIYSPAQEHIIHSTKSIKKRENLLTIQYICNYEKCVNRNENQCKYQDSIPPSSI